MLERNGAPKRRPIFAVPATPSILFALRLGVREQPQAEVEAQLALLCNRDGCSTGMCERNCFPSKYGTDV